MRAVQISELTGPQGLKLVDAPEPEAAHPLAGDGRVVVIDVEAAGVLVPGGPAEPRRVPAQARAAVHPRRRGRRHGAQRAGGEPLQPGDRVAAMCMLGGFAEVAVAPEFLTFPLADELDVAQGAGLILNYHTAYFSLVTRGRLQEGETVLVHGAAGGVGTATLQVAKGLGARTFAVVSDDEKEEVARAPAPTRSFRSGGPWKDEVREAGRADLVIDPVGGDRMTDSLRSLKEEGRLVVVGFTGGSIPEVKVNRLLLNNVSVVGAGWGAYVLSKPALNAEIQAKIDELVASGHVRPIVGARLPLERAGEALELIDGRRALGKVVLDV